MGKYFDDIHAACEIELRGLTSDIPDCAEVAEARKSTSDFDGCIALGKALSRQLRYREAAEAFSLALRIKPDDLEALRLRAGRYLSTLQTGKAYADLLRCLTLGGDALDIKYRLGLSDYFAGNFSRAMQHFEACMPLADDEMGIAVIYWHTLCAYRCVASAGLLAAYHTGTEVGHHFAYEKAVRVFSKSCAANDMLEELDSESEDLHYTITAYGLSLFLRQTGREAEGGILFENVIERNSFWPCYAYLAAWYDKNGGGESVQS